MSDFVVAAVRRINRVAPELNMQLRQNNQWAQAGSGVYWAVAHQTGSVSNPGGSGEVSPRLSVELAIERRDREENHRIFNELQAAREHMASALSHRRLSWLDGGDNGTRKRALVRTWRAFDADEQDMANWAATELMIIRNTLRPYLRSIGIETR